MDEMEVTCSKCKKTTVVIFRDRVLPGWIFQEPGWALVNHSYYCPRCNRQLKRNNAEINRRNILYPTIDKTTINKEDLK